MRVKVADGLFGSRPLQFFLGPRAAVAGGVLVGLCAGGGATRRISSLAQVHDVGHSHSSSALKVSQADGSPVW
jgi:hypothetical protein